MIASFKIFLIILFVLIIIIKKKQISKYLENFVLFKTQCTFFICSVIIIQKNVKNKEGETKGVTLKNVMMQKDYF